MVLFLQAAFALAVPILLASLGSIYQEKAGLFNLGVEGVISISAIVSFITATLLYPALGAVLALIISIIVGILSGIISNLIYGVFTITFRTNQTITGIALSLFGCGFARYISHYYAAGEMPISISNILFGSNFSGYKIPFLSQIPFVGNVLFSQSIWFYFAILLVIISAIYFSKTRCALYLKAIGENSKKAEEAGVNVIKYKYLHVIIGGAIISLAGICLATGLSTWNNSIVGYIGWIAVAIVMLSKARPFKSLLYSLLFGTLCYVPKYYELDFSSALYEYSPYLIAIAILAIILMIVYHIYSIEKSKGLRIVFFENVSNFFNDRKKKRIIEYTGYVFVVSGLIMFIAYYLSFVDTIKIIALTLTCLGIIVLFIYKPGYALILSLLLQFILICGVSVYFLDMAPYIAVIILTLIQSRKKFLNNEEVKSFGQSYFKED